MDLGLSDKTVLVAAGSQGLGRAVAERFVQEGTRNIYICARTAATVSDAAKAIGARPMVCDVTDAHQIEAMIKKIGSVDVLVTNAGGPKPGTFTEISDEDWGSAFNLTFLSAVRLIQAALPSMQARRFGRIICLTSTSVKQPLDNLITSNAMRAAVANLAKTLSFQVAKDNITVNVVAPGMYDTARLRQLIQTRADQSGYMFAEEQDRLKRTIPAQRFGDTAELAAAVVFLASEQAAYINGVLLPVDGGVTRTF